MNVRLGERDIQLRLNDRARAQLARELTPLDIEMELYFSCLLRKRVYFRTALHPDCAARANLTAQVSVSFRPVMTKGLLDRRGGGRTGGGNATAGAHDGIYAGMAGARLCRRTLVG